MPNPSVLTSPPVALQGTPAGGYAAIDLRRMALANVAQEGVISPADFKVTQRAGGAGLAVDVAAGEAGVQGDSVAAQGLYHQRGGAALTGASEVTVPAGDATSPRVDQLVLEIKDTAHDGSGLNQGQVRCVTGTPTAGATAANRLGAAVLPPSAIRLADLLMPAGGAQALTANLIDRRPWAKGALWHATQSLGLLTTTSITHVLLSALLQKRIECAGGPVCAHLNALYLLHPANILVYLQLFVDGVAVGPEYALYTTAAGASIYLPVSIETTFVPAVGSRIVEWRWRVSSAAASATFAGTTTDAGLHEQPQQSASND